MINKRDLSRLKAGQMPYSLENNPFIVMREKVRVTGFSDVSWRWSITDSPNGDNVREIPKTMALAIIRNFKMTKALDDNDGQIYEMNNSPFLKRFGRKS